MKVPCFAAAILSVSAPFVTSAKGGLKQPSRKLQDAEHCLKETADGEPGGACPNAYFTNGRQDLPSLDDLNQIYDDFCNICSTFETIDDIFNSDFSSFCSPICSIDIPDIPDISECFSEVSTVQVENQGSVTMKDLKVGARVLAGSGAYETVYAFGHKNPTHSAEFLQFNTANSNLEMTAGHLVFLEGKTNPVRADSIKVGDVLQGNNAKVMKINTVQRDGVYTPLTPSGSVVVDGIVASSYISLQKDAAEFVEFQSGISTFVSFQDIIHMALSPFRMFCMGVSSSLGNVYTEEGVPLYASYGMDFAKWADSQNIVVQFFMFLAFFAITGASMVVENTFGPSMAPFAMVAGAGVYALMRNNGISVRANKIKSV